MFLLEGDSITTGQSSQSQTSYINREICWGYRFVPCVEYDKDENKYVIHDDKFNSIVESDTPLCSAQELSGLLNEANKQKNTIWDSEVYSNLPSPMSRRSDSSSASSFKFSRRRFDIDAINRENAYSRQFSGVTLETINSVENLIASSNSLDVIKEKNDHPLSTNL